MEALVWSDWRHVAGFHGYFLVKWVLEYKHCLHACFDQLLLSSSLSLASSTIEVSLASYIEPPLQQLEPLLSSSLVFEPPPLIHTIYTKRFCLITKQYISISSKYLYARCICHGGANFFFKT